MATRMISVALGSILAAGSSLPAPADEGPRIAVAQDRRLGSFLTDGSGNSLYIFSSDMQGTADTSPQVSCANTCLEIWPPYLVLEAPTAEEGVDKSLIGTTELNGRLMATYNGWPLYTYIADTDPGDIAGHGNRSFVGLWTPVSPEGKPVPVLRE